GAGFGGVEVGFRRRGGGGPGGAREALECRDALQHRTRHPAYGADEATASGWVDAELGCDGDVRVAGEEIADAGLGLTVAVKRRDVEVADAGVVGGVEETRALATGDAGHEHGATEAEAACLAAAGCEPDVLHLFPFHSAEVFSSGFVEDTAQPGDDFGDLRVIVVAAALGARTAGGGDPRSRGFVGKIVADLLHAFFNAFEEDCLLVFDETREVAGRALDQQEAFAGGDLEGLVGELV